MQVRRLTSATDPAFPHLLRIYNQAFTASERKPTPVLEQMLTRPEYLFLAAEEDSTVLGFSIAIALKNSDAALFEYTAVDPPHRGRSIGQSLFRATIAHPEMNGRLTLVELDIESPDHPRVEHFYRRLGCRTIAGLTYLMPRVSTSEPPLMNLLVHHPSPPPAIDKPQLRAWLESCYTQVYDQSESDPRINSMLAPLPDRIDLV